MTPTNEKLLDAWLRLTTTIINPRVVYALSYNESLVCNILYRHCYDSEMRLTATDLCRETKMLKSQMNRILNRLEDKNMITRSRSTKDRREVFIHLNMENLTAYEEQHGHIMQLLDAIIERLGYEKTDYVVSMFHEISDVAEDLLSAEDSVSKSLDRTNK